MGSYTYMSISYTRILIAVLFLGNALGGPLKDEPTEDFIVQCEEICEQCHGKGEPLEHNVCQCLVPRSLDKEDQICLSHMKENAKSLGIILKSIYVPSKMYTRHTRDVNSHMEEEEEDVCLKREPRKACAGIYRDRHGSGRLPLIVGQEREEVGNARNIENVEEVGQNIEFENAAENVGETMPNDNVGAPLEEVGMEGNEETIGSSKFKKVIAVKNLKKKIKKQKKLLPLKKLAKIPIITHKKLFGKSASKIDHLDIAHGKGSHVIDKGLHTQIVPDIPKFSKSHGIKEKKEIDVSISISSTEIEKKDFSKNIPKHSLHGKKVLHTVTDIAAKKVLVHKLHKKPKFGKLLLGSPEVGAAAQVDTENVGLAPKNEIVEIQNEFEDNTVGDEHKVGAAKDSDINVGAPPQIEDAVVGNPLESEIEADSIVGSKRITENHIVVQPPSTLIENFEHKSSHIHEIGDEIIIGDPAPENIE